MASVNPKRITAGFSGWSALLWLTASAWLFTAGWALVAAFVRALCACGAGRLRRRLVAPRFGAAAVWGFRQGLESLRYLGVRANLRAAKKLFD